jgi:protein TonB
MTRSIVVAARAMPLVLLLALSAGCADTVRPGLGGLKIAGAKGPFHMPELERGELPFEYPKDAWEEGIGGETMLKIHITQAGAVDSVMVVQPSGHTSLDSAAVSGAYKLRYRPARQGEERVAVWGYLPVRFPMPESTYPYDPGRRRQP